MISEADYQLQKRTFEHRRQWPTKTVDIGANGVTVSANPLGQIYQISSVLKASNPYGIMVAAPWHQFDHRQRENPNYVRAFRKIPEEMLIRRDPGIGINIEGQKGTVVFRHVKNSIGSHAQFEYRLHEREIFVQTVLKVHDHGTVTHASRITNMSTQPQTITVILNLAFAISRAGYGQLTDRGEVKMPEPSNVLESRIDKNGAGVLAIANHGLKARVLVHITFHNETVGEFIDVEDCLYARDEVQQHPPQLPSTSSTPKQDIVLGPEETVNLTVLFLPEDISSQVGQDSTRMFNEADVLAPGDLFAHTDGLSKPQQDAKRHYQELEGHNSDPTEAIESIIFWANVNYILACCLVPISGPGRDGTCCVADHFALNLGWPRDNYWQMRLLRKLDSATLAHLLPDNPTVVAQYGQKIRDALKNHLTWLFQMAVTQIKLEDTTRYFWRRSYLVNGQPKDGKVFQLDTQCYPFLELCEYFEVFNAEPEITSVIGAILRTESFKNILRDLLSRKDKRGLFPSDETPADDDLGYYKFHLSSNVLLWHTLCKLGKLLSYPQFKELAPKDLDGEFLQALAVEMRRSILCNFRGDGIVARRDILAYGFDPLKAPSDPRRYRYYHDGNDMPTLYAREWGFFDTHPLDEDDENLRQLWENTMTWAFTPGPASEGFNSGYQGVGTEPFHGLGSDHSPGPWTLGFFQEWKFAEMIGDKERARKASRKIAKSAQFDGTFSEAVDIQDGRCTSKTWFSWPGAMIAENLLDADGRLKRGSAGLGL